MATPLAYPLTDGFRFSHGSMKFRRGAAEQFGIKDSTYKITVERAEARGHGRKPLGKTRGTVKFEASFTMLAEEFYSMIGELGTGYMDAIFPLIVTREEGDLTVTDELVGCTIDDHERSDANGADASEVKVTLGVLNILINGLEAIAG